MTTIDSVASLARGILGRGAAHRATPGYDAARTIHNGLIDKRPALIARCRNTADVVDAVNAARDSGLELSVRGGGHNVAGKAVTEGGLMIDLSLMKGIHVDPERRTVRAQGGVTVERTRPRHRRLRPRDAERRRLEHRDRRAHPRGRARPG